MKTATSQIKQAHRWLLRWVIWLEAWVCSASKGTDKRNQEAKKVLK
jgi:hypothetical protein